MGKRSFVAEDNEPVPELVPAGTGEPELVFIPLDDIALDPVTDVRSGVESEESAQEFAARIDAEGLGQPVLVRPGTGNDEDGGGNGGPGYRIIAGRRRLAAFKRLGRARIPVFVRDVDDEQAHKLAFAENQDRKDFTPVDRARQFILRRDSTAGPGMTIAANWSAKVATYFGVSRATVTEHVKMYEALEYEPSLLAKVASGDLSADAAMGIASQKADSAKVFEDAQAIAVEEASKQAAKKSSKAPAKAQEDVQGQKGTQKPMASPGQGKKQADKPAKPVKVQAKHVRKALQAKGKSTGALNKAEIIDGLAKLANKPGYPAVMSAFLNYATTDWKDGKGSQEALAQHWLAIACGIEEGLPGCGKLKVDFTPIAEQQEEMIQALRANPPKHKGVKKAKAAKPVAKKKTKSNPPAKKPTKSKPAKIRK